MRLYAKSLRMELMNGEIGVLYGCTLATDTYDPVCHVRNPKLKFNRRKKQARARTGRR